MRCAVLSTLLKSVRKRDPGVKSLFVTDAMVLICGLHTESQRKSTVCTLTELTEPLKLKASKSK